MEQEDFSSNQVYFYDVQDSHVFAFRRNSTHVVANFSENPAAFKIDAWSEESMDVLTQKKYRNHDTQILGPYEVRWLKEEVKN